jgi:hypothetical protein
MTLVVILAMGAERGNIFEGQVSPRAGSGRVMRHSQGIPECTLFAETYPRVSSIVVLPPTR